MSTEFDDAVSLFEANAGHVDRLLDFGAAIIDVAVDGLRELQGQLEDRNLHSAVTLVRNRTTLLSNVKESDSLRPQYEAMFNQCVVLLVSYFGSSLHALFRRGVARALLEGANVPAAEEELKVSWRGVAESEAEPAEIFAGLLIAQHDISFQDMQSITRAFKKHLGIAVPRTVDTENIIFGQAARHVIAHAGGIIDERILRQIADAKTRTLQPDVSVGVPIQFAPGDVRGLATSMVNYVRELANRLKKASADWSASPPSGIPTL